MKISENLQGWELDKALYLIKTANNLGMVLNDAIIDVNNNSGYVYIYSENYDFCLYMPINCELILNDVYVLYTDMNNGQEFEICLNELFSLKQIKIWVNEQSLKSIM
jgi:hypothetical protein